MNTNTLVLIAAAGALVVILAYINRIYHAKLSVEEALSVLKAMMLRRIDQLTNQAHALSVYIGHEKALLTELTQIRARIEKQPAAQIQPEEFTALHNKTRDWEIQLSAEAYPVLGSATMGTVLMQSIEHTEAELWAARRTVSANLKEYNLVVTQLPFRLVALALGYRPMPQWTSREIGDDDRCPDVKTMF